MQPVEVLCEEMSKEIPIGNCSNSSAPGKSEAAAALDENGRPDDSSVNGCTECVATRIRASCPESARDMVVSRALCLRCVDRGVFGPSRS